jgi:hypothetical protein
MLVIDGRRAEQLVGKSKRPIVDHTRNNNRLTSGSREKGAPPAIRDNEHNPKNLIGPNNYSRQSSSLTCFANPLVMRERPRKKHPNRERAGM